MSRRVWWGEINKYQQKQVSVGHTITLVLAEVCTIQHVETADDIDARPSLRVWYDRFAHSTDPQTTLFARTTTNILGRILHTRRRNGPSAQGGLEESATFIAEIVYCVRGWWRSRYTYLSSTAIGLPPSGSWSGFGSPSDTERSSTFTYTISLGSRSAISSSHSFYLQSFIETVHLGSA